MAEKDLQNKLKECIEVVSEAAKLHIKMGKHSTKEAVMAALVWRYKISEYESSTAYDAALKLLDAVK